MPFFNHDKTDITTYNDVAGHQSNFNITNVVLDTSLMSHFREYPEANESSQLRFRYERMLRSFTQQVDRLTSMSMRPTRGNDRGAATVYPEALPLDRDSFKAFDHSSTKSELHRLLRSSTQNAKKKLKEYIKKLIGLYRPGSKRRQSV